MLVDYIWNRIKGRVETVALCEANDCVKEHVKQTKPHGEYASPLWGLADLADRWGLDSLAETAAVAERPDFPRPFWGENVWVPRATPAVSINTHWHEADVCDWEEAQAAKLTVAALLKEASK